MPITPADALTTSVPTPVNDGARLRQADRGSRAWPRCEPGFTHFELGTSSDYRPTAVMAKRYTPKYGSRKE